MDKAKAEYEELKALDYDVRIRPVGGWSTLGWTKDPILSNMLKRSTGSITELIIHELTHTTLFVQDDIQFNENLATFIGEKGALRFLNARFGSNSNEMKEYVKGEADRKSFRNQMLASTKLLDELYASFPEKMPDSTKALQKHLLIDRIVSSLDTLPFHNLRYRKVFSQKRPNNAFFMSYLRYYSSEDSLQLLLVDEYDGNLKKFIKGMKEYHE